MSHSEISMRDRSQIEMLQSALAYASFGWAVFPVHSIRDGKCTCGNPRCSSPGKHPLTRHGFKDATTAPAVIAAWWRKYPWANIAVATGGKSGRLLVIDIDNKPENGAIGFWGTSGWGYSYEDYIYLRKRVPVELKEKIQSRDKFFSVIAHDLRSPLSGLLGLTQFIIEYIEHLSQDKLKESIGALRTSAKTVYALLDNLLIWSKSQRGLIEYTPETIDLAKIVECTIRLFTSHAEQKQIVTRTLVSEGTEVYADKNMLDTILRNLLNNAIKFTPRNGKINICISH